MQNPIQSIINALLGQLGETRAGLMYLYYRQPRVIPCITAGENPDLASDIYQYTPARKLMPLPADPLPLLNDGLCIYNAPRVITLVCIRCNIRAIVSIQALQRVVYCRSATCIRRLIMVLLWPAGTLRDQGVPPRIQISVCNYLNWVLPISTPPAAAGNAETDAHC